MRGNNLKKIFRFKTFYVLLVLVLLFLPTTLYMPSQAQSRAIVTAVGIDKTDNDKFEVTLALITPKSGGQVAGGNMIKSGVGDTVAIAMQLLSINLGKTIGLQHCSFIIVSDKVFEDDIAKVLDYFIRTNNLTADANLINSPKSAKKLIEQGASSSASSIATLNDIIQFNNEYLYGEAITIYEFYNRYFSNAGSVFIPIVEIEGQENIKDEISSGKTSETSEDMGSNTSSESSNSSSSNDENSNTSSSNSATTSSKGADSKTNSSKLTSNGKCAIIKKGKKVRELTETERIALNILSLGDAKGVIGIKNFSEGSIVDADIVVQMVEKKSKIKTKFENGKPIVTFDIELIVKLDEMVVDYENIDILSGVTSFMSDKMKNAFKDTINKSVFELINNMKTYKTDILFVYDNINRFHHKKLKNYINSLEDKSDYLSQIEFKTDIKIKSKV